jgi:NADH:ubiquinone oxidoreductase subunit 3 (subunit A)
MTHLRTAALYVLPPGPTLFLPLRRYSAPSAAPFSVFPAFRFLGLKRQGGLQTRPYDPISRPRSSACIRGIPSLLLLLLLLFIVFIVVTLLLPPSKPVIALADSRSRLYTFA